MTPSSRQRPETRDAHEKHIRGVVELLDWHRQELQTPYTNFLRWWKLYLAQQADKRDPVTEKWRANVFIPYPYSGVQTKAAVLGDIFSSASPLIQAEGVDDEDAVNRDPIERLLDYTLEGNYFRSKLDLWCREAGIQGTVAFKVGWQHSSAKFNARPTNTEMLEFKSKVGKGEMLAGNKAPDPQQDPQAFQAWREMVNTAYPQAKIPPFPQAGPRKVTTYRGPTFDRVSMFDLFFDPETQEIPEQEQVVQRHLLPKSFFVDKTGKPKAHFDGQAVVESLEAGGGDLSWTEWQTTFSQMLGLSGGNLGPSSADLCEVLEVYRPLATDYRYCLILNRRRIINPDCSQMPHVDQQVPIHLVRNVKVPGKALGISELQQPEKLYVELTAHRNLRLDYLTTRVMPIFTRMKEMGIPAEKYHVRPGAVWDVSREGAIQELMRGNLDPAAFREGFEIKTDIDETNSTPPQLRGNPSTVGRVSATESERRYSQALVRLKTQVGLLEDELTPGVVYQSLSRWFQFGSQKMRAEITGLNDPFEGVSATDLLEAMARNYRFRGASKAINREMQAQQLMQVGKDFFQVFAGHEARAVTAEILRGVGVRGVGRFITEEGTRAAKELWELQTQMQVAQMKMQMMQMGMAPGKPGDMGMPMAPPEAQGGAPGAPQPPGQGGPPAPGGEGGAPPPTIPGPQDVGNEVTQSLREGNSLGVNAGQAPGQSAPPPPGM